jgi:hypothetical protein
MLFRNVGKQPNNSAQQYRIRFHLHREKPDISHIKDFVLIAESYFITSYML